ncbi:TonB-dependent receptor [Neptunicella sp.]|uniref:TonB-dependent receptor n=1 Tax=Neptunicella sp. TaxID=2125986 RepID=UPI003F68D2F3
MFTRTKLSIAMIGALSTLSPLYAQQADNNKDEEVENIVITGIAGSLERSISRKRNQDLISDGISAEDLGKFPDNNIADSLQRVPGVAIDRAGGEGRFVSIRGLGPDFTGVVINGRTPATENEERAFSFDTLASELISTVDVFKTSSASLKEGGLGGLVNIVTAKPFDYDGFKFAGSVKAMYEENSDKAKPQGSFIVSNTFNDGKFGILASVTYQERATDKYTVENEHIAKTTLEPFLGFTDPSQGWAGGYAYSGDGLEEDTYRIQSLYAGITHEERRRVGGNVVMQWQATDDLILTADYIYSDYDTSTSRYWTGSYLWAPTLSDKNVVDENGFYQVINHGFDDGYNISGYAHGLTTTERPTKSSVTGLNAEWLINDEWTMVADISRSDALLDNRGLDRMYILEFLDRPGYLLTSTGGIPSIEYADEAAIKPEMGSQNMKDLRARITSDDGVYNKADNNEFKLDFKWEPLGSSIRKVKFGMNNTVAKKQTEYWQTPDLIRRMYHGLATRQEIDYNSIVTGVFSPGDAFNGLSADVYMIDPDAYRTWMANNIDGRTKADTAAGIASKEAFLANNSSWDAVKSNDSYLIEEEVTSAYVEVSTDTTAYDMPLSITAGLRYTQTDLTSNGTTQVLESLERESTLPDEPPSPWLVQTFADAAGTAVALDNSYDNWLPSVNALLKVTDEFYVRGAFSKTLTRPTLSAMAPYTSYGTTTVTTRTAMGGNPNLKPYTAKNYDLSFEYYYGDSNILALALYRKDIDNFIVRLSGPETFDNLQVEDPAWKEFYVTRPQNGKSATIEGAEINWAMTFDNGLGATANYTFVDSSASLSDASDAEQFALPGLSDTGNVSVFYNNEKLQARIAYNYRTPFLGIVFNGPSNEPIHYDSYGTVDVSLSYNITEQVTAFVDGMNITGETVNKYGRYQNQFIGFEDTGALFTVGVRVRL